MVVLFVVPNAANFVLPFTDWSAFKPQIDFVGLDTIAAVLQDGTVYSAIRATVEYAVLVAIIQNVAGLALAVLLERDTRINRFARLLFFFPMLLSALAVGYVFQGLLNTQGAVNAGLTGISGQPVAIEWLGSTTWTIVILTLIHSWKWMGLSMLIYLAGLKSVPEDIVEAARIDGADRWTTFRRIRFPLIAPAVTFNVATALIGALSSFDIILATTKGGPGNATNVINVYMYLIFGEGLFAQATVTSLVLFLLVVVFAVPLIIVLRRRENVL
ncbi:carbohydrate ABC transporter permease [uncultured Amnibacterium sp.]|uniref:carbohydrate ABC transporter permease n=1 Tax=uncultured Amnibacterium sp. TaxID=1631851 RepID=UPI0035CADC9C